MFFSCSGVNTHKAIKDSIVFWSLEQHPCGRCLGGFLGSGQCRVWTSLSWSWTPRAQLPLECLPVCFPGASARQQPSLPLHSDTKGSSDFSIMERSAAWLLPGHLHHYACGALNQQLFPFPGIKRDGWKEGFMLTMAMPYENGVGRGWGPLTHSLNTHLLNTYYMPRVCSRCWGCCKQK